MEQAMEQLQEKFQKHQDVMLAEKILQLKREQDEGVVADADEDSGEEEEDDEDEDDSEEELEDEIKMNWKICYYKNLMMIKLEDTNFSEEQI
ncbi:unnamed protein product [[Candida] boidinii]|nr:unnamed protein product [[Candida] boidinii]